MEFLGGGSLLVYLSMAQPPLAVLPPRGLASAPCMCNKPADPSDLYQCLLCFRSRLSRSWIR